MHAPFLVYSACMPILMEQWAMSATQAGLIASAFTFGYAVSMVVSAWISRRWGARHVFLASALASALTALAFGAWARDYGSAVMLYTLAALSQGGIYTPGIMLMSERFAPERRGWAVGWLLASTSLGVALSLLLSGAFLSVGGYEAAFWGTGVLPSLGAMVLWLALRHTPNVVHAPPVSHFLAMTVVLRRPEVRQVIGGYTWHSWEVLGMWAWMPAFLAAALVLGGSASDRATEISAYVSAVMHVVGAVASFSMGQLSDRLGRGYVMIRLAAAGAVCSTAMGWLMTMPVAILVAVILVYGFVAIGDSPIWSTSLTEIVEAEYLGPILALRSLVGFGAGALATLAFGAVIDLASGAGPVAAWGSAFGALGLGGVTALWYAWRLPRTNRP